MIRLIVILFAAYLTYINIENDPLIDALFIGVGFWAICENRRYINISSLIMIIVLMRGVEWLMMAWLGGNKPMVFYPTAIFIDTMAVLLIMFKIPILVCFSKYFPSRMTVEEYTITRADYLLVGIYAVYLFITLLSFLEHWYRHIDDIPYAVPFFDYLFQFDLVKAHYVKYGIQNASDLVNYFFENARQVYDIAPVFRAYFNMLEHTVILATSYSFMRSSKLIHA